MQPSPQTATQLTTCPAIKAFEEFVTHHHSQKHFHTPTLTHRLGTVTHRLKTCTHRHADSIAFTHAMTVAKACPWDTSLTTTLPVCCRDPASEFTLQSMQMPCTCHRQPQRGSLNTQPQTDTFPAPCREGVFYASAKAATSVLQKVPFTPALRQPPAYLVSAGVSEVRWWLP
jgi:hypothetical protein